MRRGRWASGKRDPRAARRAGPLSLSTTFLTPGYPIPQKFPGKLPHRFPTIRASLPVMRMFQLHRDEDPSGVSGTGVVAEGVEFTDGEVALTWVTGQHRSTVIWPQGLHSVRAIHGHDGRTRIVFLP